MIMIISNQFQFFSIFYIHSTNKPSFDLVCCIKQFFDHLIDDIVELNLEEKGKDAKRGIGDGG